MTTFTSEPILTSSGDVQWGWNVGDRDNYWGFSVMPFQANESLELVRTFITTDNNLVHRAHFVVRKLDSDPGLIRLAAFRSP